MDGSLIVLENSSLYLSEDEFCKLEKQLAQSDIHLQRVERHGPQASLSDIQVFISQHITELILTGLIQPSIYDIIKSTIKYVIFKMRGNVKILQAGGEIRDAVPCLEFKTANGEIKAPIPLTLSEEQFEIYMGGVKSAIETIKPNPQIRYENFIIEQNEKSLTIEAKTMLQYIQEQSEKRNLK